MSALHEIGKSMPLYFFDLHDGLSHYDKAGKDLPDDEAARLDAARRASEYVVKPGMLNEGGGAVVVNAHDGSGTIRFTLRLVFTVEEAGQQTAVIAEPAGSF